MIESYFMNNVIQLIFFILVLILVAPVIGKFMFRVFTGERHFLTPVLGPLERFIYRIARVDQSSEMSWKSYLIAVV